MFGLAIIAASLNLMVLKFMTMNTEDEKRDEQQAIQVSLSNVPWCGKDEKKMIVLGTLFTLGLYFEPTVGFVVGWRSFHEFVFLADLRNADQVPG